MLDSIVFSFCSTLTFTAMKQTRVLIHSLFFKPELTGISKYTGEMVDWLVENGVHCTVVTAFPFYPDWKVQKPYKNRFYTKEVSANGLLTVYRCPLYVPTHPTGLTRMLHEFTFLVSSFFVFVTLLFRPRFDRIVSVAPPFHLAFPALFYRLFRRTRILFHVQDLQVDIARELGLIKSGALLSVLERLEKYTLRRVNVVSSISTGMIARIQGKGRKNVVSFPNWVDTDKLYPLPDRSLVKAQWGFKPTDNIVLYSGNLGGKQGLDQLLLVAREFTRQPDVKFVICGSGLYKETLVRLANEMKLTNVRFMPLQPGEVFNQFLNCADLHLILQMKDASDLVMPSKLTGILAAGGCPVVTASPGTSLYEIIATNKMGILVEPGSVEALTISIRQALNNDLTLYQTNARKYAEEHLCKTAILGNFQAQLLREPVNAAPVLTEFGFASTFYPDRAAKDSVSPKGKSQNVSA